MAMAGTKFEVVKFDGIGNFGLSQTRVKDLLAQQGILKALERQKPASMDDEDWEELQQRAAGTIRLCLADEIMYHVMNLKSPGEGNDSVVLVAFSYEHLVTSLTYGKETINIDEITAALLAHNQRKQNAGESSQGDSLYVKGNQDHGWKLEKEGSGKRNSRSKSRGRKTIHCYKCKEPGHMKRDCPKLKKQADEKRDDSSKSANVVQNDDSDCSDGSGSHHTGQVILVLSVWVMIDVATLLVLVMLELRYEDRETIRIVKGALTVIKGKITAGNIYKLLGNTVVGGVHSVDSCDDNTKLWHMRLGHLSEHGMTELQKRNMLHGVKSCKLDFCKFCVFGKQTKVSFTTGKYKTEGILDYVHSDMWGPTREQSLGGYLYYVIFIDDFSRKVWVYFLKQKSEVFAKFKLWKAEVENQTGRKIKYLRSDNGTEYIDSQFQKFCEEHGIQRHFSVRKAPQQNGVAEMMNMSLTEKARCLRLNAGLPKSFWTEAVSMGMLSHQ
ncbi:Retrovirus-related Pol polyprotein from transposon TNT 1-94 [Sesamum angolense]|uniref:Retrovirus-related Pol polyprotein from transposon TNT 1-94 n=1 Tax=Sesamum angolense TaxID=2727404 RepID=A0AAE2BM62_9LAMI|nr:Retrovirus-related Pol polyprotein from transposon TNT 1-94 [Sesamum angolense]